RCRAACLEGEAERNLPSTGDRARAGREDMRSLQNHQERRQSSLLLFTVTTILFVASIVSFHDLSFPLSLVNGSVSDENLLAAQTIEGSVIRRISIPAIGILGLSLLVQ